MNKNKEVLRAFLAEKIREQGGEVDENLLNQIAEHATLREGQSDVEGEERALKIKRDMDDNITAEHISAFNLLELSFTDVFDLLLLGGAVATLGPASSLAYALAICALINEFVKKSKVELNETNAKILLALHQLKKKRFTPEALQAAYLKEFGTALPDDRLRRSLTAFRKSEIIRYLGDDIYQLRERITYERS